MLHNLCIIYLTTFEENQLQFFQFTYLSFDGDNFEDIDSSQYWHLKQEIGNYRGKAFVTSCAYAEYRDFCSRKTELLDMESLTWSEGAEFPRSFARYF